jgi:hypothetical protein
MFVHLPKNVKWYEVEITKQDLPSLKLIKEPAWNDLSFYSGDLRIAALNLDDYCLVPPILPDLHPPNPFDGRTRQQRFDDLLKSLQKFRTNAAANELDLTLVLIGTNKQGPFTILEGNHTAVALYFRYFVDNPSLKYPTHRVYVGISEEFVTYLWFHNL